MLNSEMSPETAKAALDEMSQMAHDSGYPTINGFIETMDEHELEFYAVLQATVCPR